MRDDVFELDSAESIVQGLVQHTGWVGFQEEGQPLSAERHLVSNDDFQISFIVAEYPATLNLVVELTVFTLKDVKDEHVFRLGYLITKLFNGHNQALLLAGVDGNARRHRFRFVYSWKCDRELQLELTIPVLCKTLDRWSQEISLPVVSLAPLIRLFIIGIMKEEEEFLKEADASLEFAGCTAIGRA